MTAGCSSSEQGGHFFYAVTFDLSSHIGSVKSTGLWILPGRWENVGMATKRTKADQAQRQADQLEKKSERRPEQGTSRKAVRKDSSRAA